MGVCGGSSTANSRPVAGEGEEVRAHIEYIIHITWQHSSVPLRLPPPPLSRSPLLHPWQYIILPIRVIRARALSLHSHSTHPLARVFYIALAFFELAASVSSMFRYLLSPPSGGGENLTFEMNEDVDCQKTDDDWWWRVTPFQPSTFDLAGELTVNDLWNVRRKFPRKIGQLSSGIVATNGKCLPFPPSPPPPISFSLSTCRRHHHHCHQHWRAYNLAASQWCERPY